VLPDDIESQVRVLSRLAAGKLTFRPTKESTDIIECASNNRILLNVRNDAPILTIRSKCKWTL
jgi:hypothetical protein